MKFNGDSVLSELCEMILQGQEKNSKRYGMVAASIIAPNGQSTRSTSTSRDGKWHHAERNAIDLFTAKYGTIPKGSICVTTLSPCNSGMNDRYGSSCQDLLDQHGLNKVYCGYKDPTQDHDASHETKNSQLRELCKKFADTFLNDTK
jgi:pyrimidine deaminase RibD-like protein